MTAWILSVLGTGLLGVIFQHLTAKTRLHHVVRTACIYVFILVVILPLPAIFSGGIDMESCDIGGNGADFDENVMETTDRAYFTLVEQALDKYLSDSGYETDSYIEGSVFSEKITVKKVTIEVIGEFSDSSVVTVSVREIAADYLEIEKSAISVYVGKS